MMNVWLRPGNCKLKSYLYKVTAVKTYSVVLKWLHIANIPYRLLFLTWKPKPVTWSWKWQKNLSSVTGSTAEMLNLVNYLVLSFPHFFRPPRPRQPSTIPRKITLEMLTWRVTCSKQQAVESSQLTNKLWQWHLFCDLHTICAEVSYNICFKYLDSPFCLCCYSLNLTPL